MKVLTIMHISDSCRFFSKGAYVDKSVIIVLNGRSLHRAFQKNYTSFAKLGKKNSALETGHSTQCVTSMTCLVLDKNIHKIVNLPNMNHVIVHLEYMHGHFCLHVNDQTSLLGVRQWKTQTNSQIHTHTVIRQRATIMLIKLRNLQSYLRLCLHVIDESKLFFS